MSSSLSRAITSPAETRSPSLTSSSATTPLEPKVMFLRLGKLTLPLDNEAGSIDSDVGCKGLDMDTDAIVGTGIVR